MFLLNKTILIKMSLWTRGIVLTTSAKFSDEKPQIYLSMSQND